MHGPSSLSGNENQVAGYATEYDVSKVGAGVGSFEFVTVKGGRHEVPVTAPGQGLELLARLIDGRPF
jgi:serine carboxypeptidase-like clade I